MYMFLLTTELSWPRRWKHRHPFFCVFKQHDEQETTFSGPWVNTLKLSFHEQTLSSWLFLLKD